MHKLKADLTEKRPLGEGPKKKYPALSNNEVVEKLTDYILNGVEKLNDIYENIVIVTN